MGEKEIREAARRLAGRIERTPVVAAGGAPLPDSVRLHLKLECRQRSGSFKARGATHFLLRLLEAEKPAGVVTYSSGNHGRAVAEAARDLSLPTVVTVPDDVDASKERAILAAGAEVVRAGPTSSSRETTARRIAAERGYAIVPPFDHDWIIAGQATAALEIVEDLPEIVAVWVPVGGGGLAAGIALAMQALRPGARVYTVEPEGAATLASSLAAGARVTLESPRSVADGLLPVAVGARNWEILSSCGVHPVTVTDEEITAALRWLHDIGVAAEPSGAVAAAPFLRESAATLPAGTHVAIVSGGNVDRARLAALLDSPQRRPKMA